MPIPLGGKKGAYRYGPGREERERIDEKIVRKHYNNLGANDFKGFKKRVARIRGELEHTSLSVKKLAKEMKEDPVLIHKVARELGLRSIGVKNQDTSHSFWIDRFSAKALKLAPFTPISEIAARFGHTKSFLTQLNKELGIRKVDGSHHDHGRFGRTPYTKLRTLAYLEKFSNLPDTQKSIIAGLDSSYINRAKRKNRYHALLKLVTKSKDFEDYAKLVEKKKKIGYDIEEAVYEVEADAWHSQKKIFEKLLRYARRTDPKNLLPSARMRVKRRLITLSKNEEIDIPEKLREKWGIEYDPLEKPHRRKPSGKTRKKREKRENPLKAQRTP